MVQEAAIQTDPIRIPREEVLAIIEDLMSVAEDLRRTGDDVNARLIDLVVDQLVGRLFG
jgi:hypothetical protein